MNQDKKFILITVTVLAIAVIGVMVVTLFMSDNQSKKDAIRFKEEYTALNGTLNEKNSKTYPTVEIDDLNPFVYKTEEEIINILENGNGIIYFGFSTCPWCRYGVNILSKSAINTGISEIIYLDIKDMRSSLELDENDHVVVKKDGSEFYKKLLQILDSELEDYYLTNEDGKKIKTNEKRIYAPTVITVKKGKIENIHVGTTESHNDGYREMTKEEQEDLFGIYTNMFKRHIDEYCDEAC